MKNPISLHHIRSGFTLVEFIVIMAIFTVMIGVVLFNFNGFRSAVTLDNLAHDIALSLRQIQNNAGASRSAPGEPENEYSRGIHFTKTNGGFEKTLVLFEDVNRDGVYSEQSVEELIDEIMINTPDGISAIEYEQSGVGGNVWQPIDEDVAITFKRFLPDAQFSSTSDNPDISSAYQLRITVSSTNSEEPITKYIVITKLGQISIQ